MQNEFSEFIFTFNNFIIGDGVQSNWLSSPGKTFFNLVAELTSFLFRIEGELRTRLCVSYRKVLTLSLNGFCD